LERFFAENSLLHATHPPDGHDIGPLDFYELGLMKNVLVGSSFTILMNFSR
jgi:hypothetical protein